jgi:uncharacterized membrane protein YdjX (TVP38/TMEM64 family)
MLHANVHHGQQSESGTVLFSPFVPGVELGVLLMCVFGKEGIVFVYLSTIVGLNLAFVMGRFVPKKWIESRFEKLGFSRSIANQHNKIDQMLDRPREFYSRWRGRDFFSIRT